MEIASHNSWSYLPLRKWWMKPFAFMARCQRKDIFEQYELGVRCFDLRVRFGKNGEPIVAHGAAEYKIPYEAILSHLSALNAKGGVAVRLMHEVRTKGAYTYESCDNFRSLAYTLERKFPNIKFWGGRNLYNWQRDFMFEYKPTCCERYSSVMPPKLIDDWLPIVYARLHNHDDLREEEGWDYLMLDFVDIQ